MKKALITGITGQDGSYLAELLLEKGYVVHGIKRRSSSINTSRIDHMYEEPQSSEKFFLHYGDMTDSMVLAGLINQIRPHEIYNLAAMSHVHVSFATPEYTGNADALGTLRILEAVRLAGLTKTTKIYQASTSELYGLVQETPQSELTPFYPRSPYAVAKMYAYWITKNYREAYGMFASNGILFNHESPRRGETFVTRKITRGLSLIFHGKLPVLFLGNLDAQRDWGHAKDYVKAMYLILQQDQPDDFVVATGETTSVREFIKLALASVGATITFQGSGEKEVGVLRSINIDSLKRFGVDVNMVSNLIDKVIVRVDPVYYRPTEVDLLLGNPRKIRETTGWKPEITLEELAREMMEYDLSTYDKSIKC